MPAARSTLALSLLVVGLAGGSRAATPVTADFTIREVSVDEATVRLTLYPDANHNSWDAAYADPDLPGWLLREVRFRPESPRPPR